MPRLPDVLNDADGLSIAELCSARIDGDLYVLGPAYCPVDAVDNVALRLQVALLGAPPGLIVAGTTAAWVYGALPRIPERRTLCFSESSQRRVAPTPEFLVRELVIGEHEIDRMPAGALANPARTIIDLARHLEHKNTPALIATLARETASELEAIIDRLAKRPPHPYQRRILATLRAATLAVAHPIDVVDRVDPTYGVQHSIEVPRVAHFEDKAADREAVG